MSKHHRFGPALGLSAVLALSACATSGPSDTPVGTVYPSTQPYPGNSAGYGSTSQPYSGQGTVQSIHTVKQEYQGIGGTGFGLGTAAGAVIGGVAGHQVGSGKGNTAATAVGAAAGAYVGHELEKRRAAPDTYSVTVRMDNGSYQTVAQASSNGLKAGDRVRVANGTVQRF